MTDTDIDRDAIVSVIAEMDDARRCWATRLRAALGADATAAEATDIHDLVIVDRNKLGEMLGKWGLPPWPDTADPDGPRTRGSDLDCSGMAQAISSDMDALIAAAPVTPAELLASIEAAWGVIANAGGWHADDRYMVTVAVGDDKWDARFATFDEAKSVLLGRLTEVGFSGLHMVEAWTDDGPWHVIDDAANGVSGSITSESNDACEGWKAVAERWRDQRWHAILDRLRPATPSVVEDRVVDLEDH